VSLDSQGPGPLTVRIREPISREARGRLGARVRWGEQRIVRLDALTPDQRRIVLALVDTMKTPAAVETPAGVTTEGQRHDRPS
jgi:hypothetical protein